MGRPRKNTDSVESVSEAPPDQEPADAVIDVPATVAVVPDFNSSNAAVLDLMSVLNERATSSKGYLEGDHAQHTWGVPIPALAFQYVIGGCNVLPAQRYFGFSGLEKSFKSTLAKEIGNWHRVGNGVHLQLDTEKKPSGTAPDATYWWRDDLKANKTCIVKQCHSVEEWQSIATGAIEHARAKYRFPAGQRIPVWVTIDSLNQATSNEADSTLRKEGAAASRAYPVDNLAITNWLKALNLLGTTASVGWVQHLTEDISQAGSYYGPVMKEKGAKAAGFMASCHLRMRKGSQIRAASHDSAPNPDIPVDGYTIWMTTTRSCIGPDDRVIPVDILWQYLDQPDGSKRQAMWFDWDGALGYMLAAMKYSDKWQPKMYEYDKNKLNDALFFTEPKSGRIKCDELGIDGESYTTFGKLIRTNADIAKRVSTYLGIQQFPSIQDAEIDFDAGNAVEKKKGKGR